ncbi:hypothetical protein NAPIS_ORF01631 [Vairimorpha apis BRL 01]|uniref:Uncharacterized protein n=1 Tax=Vairimorpha apis BRL 01 TaxID=1037528 RepID=T0L8F6_9MICR|nr:hypothetical protein NAPIS_ORF01631 [Vairimorpha apis BRL 01]
MKETQINDSLIILDYDFKIISNKLAIFDLDSTLLKYYESKVQKFEYQYKSVPETLKRLYKQNYSMVIVTNQSTIIINKELEKLKMKLKRFMEHIQIPFLIFISIKKDKYRKPSIGTYTYLLENYKCNNFEDVFFVGDAYGVSSSYVSDCDIKYAYNCNIKFYTPEEFFLNKKMNVSFDKFDDYTINIDDVLKPQNVYINCNKKDLYSLCSEDCTYYLFDYSKDIIKWCKGFFFTSGMFYKKNFAVCKKETLDYLQEKFIKVPFIFDESEFTSEQKQIALLQL